MTLYRNLTSKQKKTQKLLRAEELKEKTLDSLSKNWEDGHWVTSIYSLNPYNRLRVISFDGQSFHFLEGEQEWTCPWAQCCGTILEKDLDQLAILPGDSFDMAKYLAQFPDTRLK